MPPVLAKAHSVQPTHPLADLMMTEGGGGGGAKSEAKEVEQPLAEKEEAGVAEEESDNHQIDRIEDLIADEEEEVEAITMAEKDGCITVEGAIEVQPAASRKLSAQVESKGAGVVVQKDQEHETLSQVVVGASQNKNHTSVNYEGMSTLSKTPPHNPDKDANSAGGVSSNLVMQHLAASLLFSPMLFDRKKDSRF